jgi:hypothetical protein
MDGASAYLDMTGRPVPSASAAEGRKWIVEDFDLFSALRSSLDRTLTLKDWVGVSPWRAGGGVLCAR